MKKSAYFAGGCFWCITPSFYAIEGVSAVTAGYSGGGAEDAVYALVKSQSTMHRETVRVDYEDSAVAYEKLLDVFLCGVDPFDGGGQFIDRGRSYTLAVYWQDEGERAAAEAAVRAIREESGREVFISIEPFESFFTAEEEHQDYFIHHPEEFEKELIESGRKK